jgi:hypothetical protein
MPTAVRAEQIRSAMESYLAEMRATGQEPPSEPGELYLVAAKQLGMDYSVLRTPWQRENAREKFTQQALRALHRLAREGVLVRTGTGRTLTFITLEEDTRRKQAESDRAAETADAESGWRNIKKRLRALGLIETGAGSEVMMPLPVWEQLLNLAEKGEECLSHFPPL